jgi:hypothetical protein
MPFLNISHFGNQMHTFCNRGPPLPPPPPPPPTSLVTASCRPSSSRTMSSTAPTPRPAAANFSHKRGDSQVRLASHDPSTPDFLSFFAHHRHHHPIALPPLLRIMQSALHYPSASPPWRRCHVFRLLHQPPPSKSLVPAFFPLVSPCSSS